ncbi:Fatty-acid amide hydrolase 1 [Aphelenchoides besseyi]|nr:Fatty-acid amide hydrolase 1 [Aphelenchoides besseyi]
MGNMMVSAVESGLIPNSPTTLFLGVVWFCFVSYFTVRWLVLQPWSHRTMSQSLINENEKKRQSRFQAARIRCEDLNVETRNEILSLDFFQLRDALQTDKYNAETVLKAFTWKALEVQEEINCVAEFLIESYEKARELDSKYYGKSNKPPLYGLPFSVKGNFHVANYDCCVGLTKYLNDPKPSDCTIVTALFSLGAVPFVLTNIPQALLSFVCSNPVYGTTKNPHAHDRIPGGSSGGDAAIVAAKASSFGTGSDLAGSLRIPAAMCGIVSLKPTEHRFSIRNCVGGVPGRGRMALGTGFFTHTVDEQIYLLEQILKNDYLHLTSPRHIPLPLRLDIVDQTVKKTLRIGYFEDDGFLKATPGCARVVRETVEKLKAAGHELVLFKVPRPYDAAELCYKSIMTDGGSYLCKLYSREIVDQYMKAFVFMISTPLWVRYAASMFLKLISPQAAVLTRSYVKSIEELRLNQEHVDTYTEEYFDLWNEMKIDGLICPSFCVPPVEHKYPSLLGACGFATGFVNMLDFPSGVVPVDSWTKQDDEDVQNESVWPVGKNFVLKFMREASVGAVGLPLSVQVVTRPWHEEQCLAIMKIVENVWNQN